MFLKEGKLVVALFIFMLTMHVYSSAQQPVQTKMIVTQKETMASSPIKTAIVAKYGGDEAKMGEAMRKVREQKAKDKIVVTAEEYRGWERSKRMKLDQAKSAIEKEKIRKHIAKREAKIVVVEDII